MSYAEPETLWNDMYMSAEVLDIIVFRSLSLLLIKISKKDCDESYLHGNAGFCGN